MWFFDIPKSLESFARATLRDFAVIRGCPGGMREKEMWAKDLVLSVRNYDSWCISTTYYGYYIMVGFIWFYIGYICGYVDYFFYPADFEIDGFT